MELINKIHQGSALEILKTFPDKFINTCVTSPPYWGLRDYGTEGQLGLEKTPEEYVQKMVDIFREVKRTLKDDGTLWLNLGDSYNGSGGAGGDYNKGGLKEGQPKYGRKFTENLKPKDLVGIPWMVAFALRADGWYLRQDIIWHKPNPMPESVQDRCTKAHEYIFLLSKSQKYYYDAEAIKEDVAFPCGSNSPESTRRDAKHSFKREGSKRGESICPKSPMPTHRPNRKENVYDIKKRNKRSVWTVNTKPYKEAHFAVFPPELILPCILAGCPKDGIVVDPFSGSGTTAEVAKNNSCNYIGIELNPEYIELSNKRLKQEVLY